MRRTNLRFQSANVLNHLINEHGLQQARIAEILGVDRSYVSRACKAERSISVEQMALLADHLGVELGVLLLATHKRDAPPSDPKIAHVVKVCEEAILAATEFSRALKQHAAKKKRASAA
jgi:transcriptional regulator with XRE-family HTH domain